MIALDKKPGVRPVGVGETLRQLMVKCVLWVIGQESKAAVNGTELGAQEWLDALFLRYGLDPPDLPRYCNGCNATFAICHALDCKWGGLVTARHKELRDGVMDLAGKYFTPSHVSNNSLIFAGCAMKMLKKNPARSKSTTVTEATPMI